ncbi:zinc finger protein castor homolog 1 [Abrus precatorius]|uniref:Zinc finger protein castor homolog 1 n=1 Tax=Abrus precatorius TaxID=3816 RepID=A0A8B8KD22_ABRPR|nr:zinc finger protein castor homolog 1 [Abrus precatorius]
MATWFCFSNPTISHPFAFASLRVPPFPNSPALRFTAGGRKSRGSAVVTRAGPSTTSIVFAIALPLSLLAVTVLASVRMADKLDQQWLEELAKNEATMEVDDRDDDEDDEDDDNDDYDNKEDIIEAFVQEELSLPRARNRPRREA